MFEALLDHRGGYGDDVGAHARSLDDMHGVADACDQHLGRVLEVVENVDDLSNQVHSGRGDIVEAADEGAHIRGS